MVARSVFFIGVLSLMGGLEGSASAQSLKEVVEQTLKTSPDVLIDVNQRLSTDEALKGARGGYLPKLDLEVGRGREWSDNATTRSLGSDNLMLNRREASLTLRQMIFDGFAVSSEVNRNKARVESAAYKVSTTSQDIALRAIEAYHEVLRNRELVALTRDNVSAHERTFDQIRIRSESGLGRKADLEQVNARLALARSNLVAAEANLRDAEINFQRIVAIKPGALDKASLTQQTTLPQSLNQAIDTAIANNPALKSAQADVDAATAQTAGAKSSLWPRFDLELGGSKNRDMDGVPGPNNDKYVMLRLRYNLFNGGSDVSRVNETVRLSSEARAVLDRAQRQVAQSTELSWNALASTQQRLASLKEHAEFSAATRDAYTKQFNIGQRTLLDLLDAENEKFTAASNYINAQYLESFAKYRLEADIGELLPSVGVNPPEEAAIKK